jgi:hypothetical protein
MLSVQQSSESHNKEFRALNLAEFSISSAGKADTTTLLAENVGKIERVHSFGHLCFPPFNQGDVLCRM